MSAGPRSLNTAILDGAATAARVREDVAADVKRFAARHGWAPGLATVLVGEDPASAIYVASKRRLCVEAGMSDHHRKLPADAGQEEVERVLRELGADPAVSGILLQLPVPEHLDVQALLACIPEGKDVDGLTTASAGLLAQNRQGLRPCTPSGVIELLDTYRVPLEGRHAVVVGRSELVGKPMSQLLLARHATVTVCHSRTADLQTHCRSADVLVAAAGVPRLIGAAHVKPGAVVIDVGIHRTDDGLCGGVGPMTIAMLLRNTLQAATRQADG
jgi:methylenetetrahydrofolate dehydrogenase (NADP+)/methenyltetrahydrofolate cyclohydrolase